MGTQKILYLQKITMSKMLKMAQLHKFINYMNLKISLAAETRL